MGRGRIGIEFYVPDDKELGCKVIGNAGEFERRLGAVSKPIDATKASGLRLYKGKYKIKDNEGSWPEIIKEQMAWPTR